MSRPSSPVGSARYKFVSWEKTDYSISQRSLIHQIEHLKQFNRQADVGAAESESVGSSVVLRPCTNADAISTMVEAALKETVAIVETYKALGRVFSTSQLELLRQLASHVQ